MNSTKILPPHIPYTLPCSFGAIDHGKIYVGQFGTDPTVVANRIPIYIMDINGKMTRVEQPIITNSAGQSMYNDVPTNFYCFDRYSIMVQNAYGDKLFFEMIPGGEFGIPARFDFRTGGTVTTHDMVVFHPAAPGNNHYYFWEGALPKTVPANSSPTPLGPGQWVDVALRLTQDGFDDDYDNLLRFELGANSGATLVGTSTGENVEERITNLTPEDIGAQPVDATLTAMAGVVTAADKIIYFDGVDTAKPTTLTGFGRSLIDDANAAAARTTLGAQAADATLTAMAGVVTAADKIIYFDGVDTAKSTTLTGFGRSLIDDANAAAARTTLGAQAADATLTAIAGVVTAADKIIYFDGVDTAKPTTLTGFGRSLIDDAGASEARTTLGAAATVHTHAISDITNLQVTLDGKLELAGGTMTGNLTAPLVKITGTPTDATDATTKSYVDTAISTAVDNVPLEDYLPLTGGNLTGELTISTDGGGLLMTLYGRPESLPYIMGATGNVGNSEWYLGQFGTSTDVFLSNYDLSNYIALKSGYAETGVDLRLAGAQGIEPNSLTRRDFVETNFVNKAGDEMTGGLRALNFQARDIEQGMQGIRIGGGADYSEVIPVDSEGSVLWTESLRYLPDTGKWTAQTQGTDPTSLTTKQYVDDAVVASSNVITYAELGDAVDMDTISTPGFYKQSSKSQAVSATNYPPGDHPGVFIVHQLPQSIDSDPETPPFIMQTFYGSQLGSQYFRVQFISGSTWYWSVWYELYNGQNPPSLTDVGATLYGLGGEAPATVADCNGTSQHGEHGGWFKTTTTTTNTPYTTGDPKTNNGIMHTLAAADKNKTQIFYAAGADPETWIRNVYDNAGVKTWGAWQKVFPTEGGGGSTTLGGLTDVADTVTSATEGQVLAYNATSLEWEARTPAAGGGITYTELGAGVNLNDITTYGYYVQRSKTNATSGTNYPASKDPGTLLVEPLAKNIDSDASAQVLAMQRYYIHSVSTEYFRIQTSPTTWGSWVIVYNGFNKPSLVDVGATGYGLGGEAPATTDDCNSTSATNGDVGGWFRTTTATTNTPYTTGDAKTNNAIMHTLAAADKNKTQLYYASGPDPETWIRNVYDDAGAKTWGAWQKVFPAEGGGSTTLGGLTDVADTVSSATEGQVLTYNATSLEWEAKTPAAGGSGGGITFTELGDAVDLNTITTPGYYIQRSKSEMQSGSNYPTAPDFSGTLVVYPIPSHTYDTNPGEPLGIEQFFYSNSGAIRHYSRQYNNDFGEYQWSSWSQTFNQTFPPNLSQVGAFIHGLGTDTPEGVDDCSNFYALQGGWHRTATNTLNAPYPVDDPKLNGGSLVTFTVTQLSLAQLFFCTSTTEMWIRTGFSPAGGTPLAWSEWAQIFPSAVTLGDVDALRAENQSLRDRVDALEQLVNQILGVG